MNRVLEAFSFLLCLVCLTNSSFAQSTAIYKYGVFDSSGKQVLPFEYDAIQVSNDGKHLILKKGDQLIHLDAQGQTTIAPATNTISNQALRYQEIPSPSPKYDFAWRYTNGYTKVRHIKNKKGGILSPKGKEIIKCKYDWFYLDILENGLIKGKEENSYQLFNNKGKLLGEFDDIGSKFNNNRLLVVKEDLFGFVNRTGEITLPIIYKRARAFSNNHAFVIQDDTAYYINPQGERVITLPPETHDGQAFQDNLVVVKDKNGNHSLVNAQSEVLFTLPLSHLSNFQHGIAAAKKSYKGDTWGVINRKGETVIPFQYHETKVYNIQGTNLIAIRKEAEEAEDVKTIEDNNKKPSLAAKAYCYTAIIQYPKINALGATQLLTKALFIELFAPYRMKPDRVKKRGHDIVFKQYPKAKIAQEFFTEVDDCLEIRERISGQMDISNSELIEEHID